MTEINAQFLDGVAKNHGYALCYTSSADNRTYSKSQGGAYFVVTVRLSDARLKYDSCNQDNAKFRSWLDAKFI